MNKERRKALMEVSAKLGGAKTDLECIRDEEREAFENLADNFQQGEQGEQMEEYIGTIEERIDELESMISELEDIGNG